MAAVLDRQALRGLVIPVEFVEQVIDGSMKSKLQAWLAAPQSRFYLMHVAGSFFEEGSEANATET